MLVLSIVFSFLSRAFLPPPLLGFTPAISFPLRFRPLVSFPFRQYYGLSGSFDFGVPLFTPTCAMHAKIIFLSRVLSLSQEFVPHSCPFPNFGFLNTVSHIMADYGFTPHHEVPLIPPWFLVFPIPSVVVQHDMQTSWTVICMEVNSTVGVLQIWALQSLSLPRLTLNFILLSSLGPQGFFTVKFFLTFLSLQFLS